jgi:hypothetical protein
VLCRDCNVHFLLPLTRLSSILVTDQCCRITKAVFSGNEPGGLIKRQDGRPNGPAPVHILPEQLWDQNPAPMVHLTILCTTPACWD